MAARPLTDEQCREAAEAAARFPNHQAAADSLGMDRMTFRHRLRKAAQRGFCGTEPVLPGYRISKTTAVLKDGEIDREYIQQRPDHGEQFEVPEGHRVKGISALVGADGSTIQQWIKTREGELSPESLADILKAAFDGYESSHVPCPVSCPVPDADLLNLFPCNDWHLRLLTWSREVGENWDLDLAESKLGDCVEDVIARSPVAGTAIVLGGGDLLHADTDANRTAQSGNVLDADGRHRKGIEVACRLKVRTIEAALRRNERVIVRILPGNHDEYSSVAVTYFLAAWFRNDPRVEVDTDASLFFWHRFGKVLLGATHGHTVKLKDMPSIMAHRRAEDWGATVHRYVHGFHVHHKSMLATEGNGVIAETHQAPIPSDAWHFGSGYLSSRSMQSITYHASKGEIARVRMAL